MGLVEDDLKRPVSDLIERAKAHARAASRVGAYETRDIVRELIAALEGHVEPEWEYGSNGHYIPNDDRIFPSQRTPENWYGADRPIYRRRCAVPPGEWEVYDGPVTMEQDKRPWLFPGKDPDSFPAEHRRAHQEGGMEFRPRRHYEQDIEAYGFRYAVCGRTQEHFPHSKLDGTDYCSGVLA